MTSGDRQAANDDLRSQADPGGRSSRALRTLSRSQARDFDGDPARLTEMDALVAYLQMLGTLVDFKRGRAAGAAQR